ncbi:MAG: tetratricopeptide repeat protein [Magnetococcales bacterium]|nr:tetratricopeptide repeat protein [Magnetococcales bacterium]
MNRLYLLVCAFGLLSGSFLLPAPLLAAESLDDIYAMADRKEFDTALKRLNTFLNEHPQDAQGRFLKGLILTETKQRDQAITVFQQLSKDFPELPEPYNNLAVLYAEQGHFDKAQEALTQAVKAHPNYATAHENLGDIHAKMASQSYARALKLNQGNQVLASKLNKVKTLFSEGHAEAPTAAKPGQATPSANAGKSQGAPAKGAGHATTLAQAEGAKSDNAPPKPVMPTQPEGNNGAASKSASEPAKSGDGSKSVDSAPTGGAATSAVAEGAKPESPAAESAAAAPPQKAEEPAKKPDPNSANEVKQVVLDWAAAWSAKETDRYIDIYSPRFQPIAKNLKTREAWEKNRREVIGKAGSINIHVSDLQITMLNENRAQATFQQNYTAKNYRDRVKKTLSLERENQTWKIVREYANE